MIFSVSRTTHGSWFGRIPRSQEVEDQPQQPCEGAVWGAAWKRERHNWIIGELPPVSWMEIGRNHQEVARTESLGKIWTMHEREVAVEGWFVSLLDQAEMFRFVEMNGDVLMRRVGSEAVGFPHLEIFDACYDTW